MKKIISEIGFLNTLKDFESLYQISGSIGKALELNDELVEAFALGHDLGHIPLDHGGERTMN